MKGSKEQMVKEKTWDEFRNTGLLWWINAILHTFGWAICMETEKGKIIRVFPARVKYRGFDTKNNSEGYIKVSEYMSKNSEELLRESRE